jgi:uncharacterized repeat protein (TIGR01451 family)
MRMLRGLVVVVCAVAAGLVVSAGPAVATPTPVRPPVLTKSFNPSTIPLNGTTTLSLTVSNPNPTTTLTGVTVTDTLPEGLFLPDSPFQLGVCGGVLEVTANSIAFKNIRLQPVGVPGNLCGYFPDVQGTTIGTKVNTTSAVTSNEGGTGSAATATLVVQGPQPPTLTKAFSPPTVRVGDTTRLTFTLTNPNPTLLLSRVTFADPFPGGLSVAANPAVTSNCGGVPSVGPFALAVAYANVSFLRVGVARSA